jgi:hypothetical protein
MPDSPAVAETCVVVPLATENKKQNENEWIWYVSTTRNDRNFDEALALRCVWYLCRESSTLIKGAPRVFAILSPTS